MLDRTQSLLVLTNPRARQEINNVNKDIDVDPLEAIRKMVDIRSKANTTATRLLNTDSDFVDSLGHSYHNWALDNAKQAKPDGHIRGKANKKAAKRLRHSCA
jgi:hypothetical protein